MLNSLLIPKIDRDFSLSEENITNAAISRGAKIEINSVNWPEDFPDNRLTEVYCFHDTKNIFILFVCRGEHLKATVDSDLGPVATDSCVEFFISPDLKSTKYWNFEFNAIGRKNISSRLERLNPVRFSQSQLEQIIVYPSEGKEPFAEKIGIHEWTLAVVIPLSTLDIEYQGVAVEMKGNFYKCGSKTSSPHYLSWAPINTEKPDFHCPDFFAPMILE